MKHKLKEIFIVPRGLVFAESPSGERRAYLQGQRILAGHTIVGVDPPELETVFGIEPEPAVHVKSKKEKEGHGDPDV